MKAINLALGNQAAYMRDLRREKAPAMDALARVANNMTAARAQQGAEEKFSALRANFDAYQAQLDKARDERLKELDTEMLWGLRSQYCACALISIRCGEGLETFRDGLSAFDETIGSYQKMLDGLEDLPKRMTLEDVGRLLEAAKTARGQYLRDGVEQLNALCFGMSGDEHRGQRYITGLLGKLYGDKYAGIHESAWTLDADARDIYAEIDRVSDTLQGFAEDFRDGYARINRELERRLGDRYRLHFAAPETQTEPAAVDHIPDPAEAVREYMLRALEKQKEDEED